MKIKKIALQNIGVYEKKEFSFDEFFLITGRPRIGKTTVLNAIQSIFLNSNSFMCKNITSYNSDTGYVMIELENLLEKYTIKRSFGSKKAISVNDVKCKDEKSLIEFLKLTPSDISGIFSENFFDGSMTGREKRDAIFAAHEIKMPDLLGYEGEDNPIKSIDEDIRFKEKLIKDNSSNLENKKKLLEEKISGFEYTKEDYEKLNEDFAENLNVLNKMNEEYNSKENEIKKVRESVNSAIKGIAEFESKYSEVEDSLNKISTGKCPMCGSEIAGKEKEEKIKELEDKKENFKRSIDKGKKIKKERESILKEKEEFLKQINKDIININKNIEQIKNKLSSENNENVMDILKKDVTDLEEKISLLEKEVEDLKNKKKEYTEKVLPDIETNINNMYVTGYFKSVDISIFKENFEPDFSIKFDGKDFKSLSGEEKIFAKMELASFLGSKCILMDGLESCDHTKLKVESCKLGIQVIGTKVEF